MDDLGESLIEACYDGDFYLVRRLIEDEGCDPKSVRDDGGWAPLYWAFRYAVL